MRDRLLGLPQRLVRGIAKGDQLTRTQALRVQTALMIEILIVAPVRLRNLAALDLDRHFERPGGGREAMLLRFSPNEVKNATGLHHELRAVTRRLLDLYLTSARPVLCGVPGTLLFPGRSGKPKLAGSPRRALGPRDQAAKANARHLGRAWVRCWVEWHEADGAWATSAERTAQSIGAR